MQTRRLTRVVTAGTAAMTLLATVGCGTTGPVTGSSAPITVVAAENFWGSIAAQLGGSRVTVTAIISSPDTDPHAYEPTPRDGRSVAQAQYVVINGAGYDPWAPKLVEANPSQSRLLLTVADLAGRKAGDNPHMWYSPAIVTRVVDHITADFKSLDSADASYFDEQAATFKAQGLKSYTDIRTSIKKNYAGAAVGATESIFVDLAAELGLSLITPPDYMRSISEGTDPTAADKATFDSQIGGRQIKVLVFNKQNSTPDIRALVNKATSMGIPVVAITETLDPTSATFQDWQSGQLSSLQAALAKATGH